MTERLVFIAVFADIGEDDTATDYYSSTHVKAWCLYRCMGPQHENELTLLYSDGDLHPFTSVTPFDQELVNMLDVDMDDPAVPDIVWARLAEYRLLGSNLT